MVTIKIPRPLYERLGQLIEGTGFRSVTEFATYVLRDLASHPSEMPKLEADSEGRLSPEELRAIRNRLKELGYI